MTASAASRPRSAATIPFALLAFVASCGDQGEAPEVRAQRESVHRQACVAGVLAERADDNVRTLVEALSSSDPADPIAQITRRATESALDFARAYQRHAELRVGAYGYLDSAVNRSKTPADSARYADRASSFLIRIPAEGTVEANVMNSYQNDFLALLSDPNHPCNWDFPF
jgi:hypothetical protein